MYRLGKEPHSTVGASTLADMKHALKLTCEAQIARNYGTFVVIGDNGVRYDVHVKIELRRK